MNGKILLFSKRNAARILGISERTLHTLISTKQLRVRRVGRRVLIAREALEQFANRGCSTKITNRAAGARR